MKKKCPQVFLLDVDGVMTDGKYYYTSKGKVMKMFGSDDHDALTLLAPYIEVRFITGDHRGFPITKRRIVDDMKMPLELVSTVKRIEWIQERWNPQDVIYMGDGIFDHYVFRAVGYAIAPANADAIAKRYADYITKREGGDRAVAEACLHLLRKFFKPYNPLILPDKGIKLSGKWSV
jgi:3-deoxy-D-manno-octulosonate 8-phosphate phosphatase (KDO 8-P phosphatase)